MWSFTCEIRFNHHLPVRKFDNIFFLQEYDATCLVKKYNGPPLDILIDQVRLYNCYNVNPWKSFQNSSWNLALISMFSDNQTALALSLYNNDCKVKLISFLRSQGEIIMTYVTYYIIVWFQGKIENILVPGSFLWSDCINILIIGLRRYCFCTKIASIRLYYFCCRVKQTIF